MKNKTPKPAKDRDLAELLRVAEPALGKTSGTATPPTIYDLVSCLTNMVCNLKRRVRELEQHIRSKRRQENE